MKNLTDEARSDLDRRAAIGRRCIEAAGTGEHFEVLGEDQETYAKDAISNILTALYGPAGYCVQNHASTGPDDCDRWSIDGDPVSQPKAKALLDLAYESWQGDAEDYDVPLS